MWTPKAFSTDVSAKVWHGGTLFSELLFTACGRAGEPRGLGGDRRPGCLRGGPDHRFPALACRKVPVFGVVL